MEVSGRIHCPAALHPDNLPLVPTDLEAEWARKAVWTLRSKHKFFPCRYSNPGSLIPYLNHKTDYDIPALILPPVNP